MEFKLSQNGKYSIITVSDSLNIISELSDLKKLIEEKLNSNTKNIAVKFLNTDYLYSGAISVLVSVYKQIKIKGGVLCILEPNPKIQTLLDQMCITNIIPVYSSVADLP